MSVFHLFSDLPLELRQRIWELSMEPRQVVIGKNSPYKPIPSAPSVPPPSVLQACVESRSHLEKYYNKSFRTESPTRYSWVNFDIDTIYTTQYELRDRVRVESQLIQHLVIEGHSSEFFFYNGPRLDDMKALKTVTILHMESPGTIDEEWWTGWDTQMEVYYFRDDPVPFETKIVYPHYPPYEINQRNYLKVERDRRRRQFDEDPESWEEGYEISDDDDEVMSVTGRFRLGWHHVEGCNCPSRRSR